MYCTYCTHFHVINPFGIFLEQAVEPIPAELFSSPLQKKKALEENITPRPHESSKLCYRRPCKTDAE